MREDTYSVNESVEPSLNAFDMFLNRSNLEYNGFVEKCVKTTTQILHVISYFLILMMQMRYRKNIKNLTKDVEK